MKRFQKLSDDELNAELDRYNKIIEKYQKPIEEYDKFFKEYKENKIEKNPIVFESPLILKETGTDVVYLKGITEEHFIEASGLYILTKEGARIAYNEKNELFFRRKRQIELILRGRKKDKEKTENVGYVYVLSNKSLPPNTYKIGSTYGNPEERAEELTGTGHLHPFKVESNIKIQSAEYYERKIHSLLKNYRVKQNREFFEIDLNKIKNCLKQVSEISEKGSKKITLTDLKKEINL